MKKTITTVALLAGAMTAYSQGTIQFQDYNGSGPNIVIFGQQTLANSPVTVAYGGYTVYEQQGNPSGVTYIQQWPGGSAAYPAANPLTGSGYDVQLLAATGNGDALNSLTPQGTISTAGFFSIHTFVTGIFIQDSIDTFNTGAGVPGGPATIALAVWQNIGPSGAASTLAKAQADGYLWGISDTANVTLTSGTESPVYFPFTLTSFSLGVEAIPEPSTIALGVIGATAFLMRLRRNK